MINKAIALAFEAHNGQFRKDGKTPYITHPAQVATLYAIHVSGDIDGIATMWLHDVIEDTEWTKADIEVKITDAVARDVDLLTKVDRADLSREQCNYLNNEQLAASLSNVRLMKLCDRLCNVQTIKELPDPERYAVETVHLLEALHRGEWSETAERGARIVTHSIKNCISGYLPTEKL